MNKIGAFELSKLNYDHHPDYSLNNLEVCGLIFLFAKWASENGITTETPEEIYDSNTSGLRDENRIDFFDDYDLTGEGRYWLTYIWATKAGISYVSVYDSVEGTYIGNIEIF